MAQSYTGKAIEELLSRARSRLPKGNAPVASGTLAIGERVHRMVQAMDDMASARNPAETEAAHAMRLIKAAAAIKAEVKVSREKLNAALGTGMANIRQKIDAVTGLTIQTAHAAELRTIFRGMEMGAQIELIKQSMEKADIEVLSAVLGVHPLLSGIDPKFQADMRHSYETKVAPDLVTEEKAILEIDSEISALLRAADRHASDAEKPEFAAKMTEATQRADAAQAAFASAASEQQPFAAE